MPFFSIIIPVYNVAPYLRECLDSVLAQTFADWEAVCVDDGSTDGSGAILDEYGARDSRFHVVHKQNGGVSVARNLAIEAARGDYVGFVDADDAICPDWLRRANECIETANADVVRFEMQRWMGGKLPEAQWNGVLKILSDRKTLVEWGWPKYLSDDCGGPWNVFARRYMVQDHGTFPAGMRMKEDRIFLLNLLMRTNRMALGEYPGYFYRKRNDGACGSKRKVADVLRYMDEVQRLFEKFENDISRVGARRPVVRATSWTVVNDIEELMEQGDIVEWGPNREIPARLAILRRNGLLRLSFGRPRYVSALLHALIFGSMRGFALLMKIERFARKVCKGPGEEARKACAGEADLAP